MSYGYPVTKVLRILQLNKSTYYYNINKDSNTKLLEEQNIVNKGGRPISGLSKTNNGKVISDEQVKEYICEIIESKGLCYGYYKITIMLKRKFKLIINKKKVYRLCKELNVLRSQRQVKPKHPRKIAQNREITKPNSLWEVDIKYGYINGEDRFFYIASFLDVYDRNIVEYHMGLLCTAEDIVITLKRALMKRNLYNKETGLVIRSDNGPQFISHKFEDTCKELNLEHERIPFKSPNKNAHIESFHRLLEDECLSRYEFKSYAESYETVSEYMKSYNKVRIHSSLGYISPMEFYQKILDGTAKSLIVKL
ncbi:IS3 family transposase [Anaerosalibacter massiliensis]|uniref:IS3 family transposase n=1 Tax=Anaerosalibacter massiliensis TaxID=1347392 RepID=A0A9X2S6T0_9FIRM|nr:IS3 family transposase [Anaerosalibacter massiliensis]MCR2043982.1 IS3 family transposase [Anaerosalibacter massiliensis]